MRGGFGVPYLRPQKYNETEAKLYNKTCSIIATTVGRQTLSKMTAYGNIGRT
jgi:hypothetical protein